MKTILRKASRSLVAIILIQSLSGFGTIGVASAQTSADYQVQISALLAQIAQLQAMMSGGTMTTGTAAYTFTRDLTVGSSGADVTALQQTLVAKGYLVMPAGVAYGTFGNLTKMAVAKWQAASGITPAAGYFGAKSRAAYAAMNMGTGTDTGTGTGTGTGTVNTGTSLLVSKSANNPTGAVISGAGQNIVMGVNFTAPSTMGMTVTGLTFQKVGVISTANINNAYLVDGNTGEVKAQYQSLTNDGVMTFSNLNLMVNAGQTWNGQLRIDLSSSSTSGNTLAFNLTGVTTAGNNSVSGLPVVGNTLTVTSVSNPSIATLALAFNQTGTSVDAGTNSVLVASLTSSVTNSAVDLKNMQFTFVGSANPADFRNLRLLVNGAQVATLDRAATETVFVLPTPIRLSTGQSTIQVFADITGSPYRTYQFKILQNYKVSAVDTQYGAGITVTVTDATTAATINAGSIITQVSTTSPTTPIPASASGVTLGKFTIFAAGETVQVKFLDVTLTQTGSENWTTTVTTFTDDLSNLRIQDDAGGQLGNTISTLSSDGGTATTGACTVTSTTVLTCHFGTSGSPINYLVPANTTRTLSVVADIGANIDSTSLAAGLGTPSSANLQGQISSQTASTGAVTAAIRTVTSSSLTPSLNGAYSSPTIIAGANNQKVASFVVTASSAQGAQISSLTFDKDSDSTFDMQNMRVMVGSAQFGTTRATIGDSETSLAFSASTPITVTAGSSVTIDVYADVLSTTSTGIHTNSVGGTITGPVDLIGWSAIGSISGSAITMTPSAVEGQLIIVGDAPTITISVSGTTPPAKQVVMGSTGNELARFRFTNDNVATAVVSDITISDTITSGSSTISFYNAALYDTDGLLLTEPKQFTLDGSASSSVSFELIEDFIISKGGTKEMILKADVPTYADGGAQSGSTHVFKINDPENDVAAQALDFVNIDATITGGTASANAMKVYRTKLALSGAGVEGSLSSRTRTNPDDVARFTFNNTGNTDQLTVSTVILRFQGAAVSGVTFNVSLLKTDNTAFGSSSNPTSCATVANSCAVTFSPAFILSPGQSQGVKVRVDSTGFFNSTIAGEEGLSIYINATTDVLWEDGTSSSIPLEASVVPYPITTVSYN